MTKINLLPWREQLRAARQRQLLRNFIAVLMLAVGAVLVLEGYLQKAVAQQNQRNGFVRKELSALNKQMTELRELQTHRQQLSERMSIIYQLQDKRAASARILDQVVRTLPKGVYVTDLKLIDQRLIIEGVAESNKLISRLMRQQAESEWLTEPSLAEVQALSSNQFEQANRFKLTVQHRMPSHRVE